MILNISVRTFIKLIFLFIIISLTLILSWIIYERYLLYNKQARIEMNIKERYKIESNIESDGLLYYDRMINLKDKLKARSLTFYSQIEAKAKNGGNNGCPVQLVLSGEGFMSFFEALIPNGVPLNEKSLRAGDRIALISESLAVKMYKSYNIIGSYIYINNIKYRIEGIYKVKGSIYENLVSEGIDNIFVPFGSYSDYGTIPVHTIIMGDERYKEYIFRTERFSKEIASDGNVDINNYIIKDYYDSGTAIYHQFRLILLITGLTAIIILSRLFIRYIKVKCNEFRSVLIHKYMHEIMLDNIQLILIPTFLSAGFIIIVYLMLKTILYTPVLPEDIVLNIVAFDIHKIVVWLIDPLKPYGYDSKPTFFEIIYMRAKDFNTILIIGNILCNILFCKISGKVAQRK